MKQLLLVFFLLTFQLFAQELDVKVTTNVEKLQMVHKDLLVNFANVVQDYMNSNKYTGGKWEGDRIKVNINVFFESGSDLNKYSAQVFLNSVRPVYKTNKSSLMLNIIDSGWEFFYQRGQSLYYDKNSYNDLTSFLDFYALLIIGLDSDSFEALSGTQFYSQALDIALLGEKSGGKGWESSSSMYSRRGIVSDLLNEKYRIFRENFFDYHYNGLDIMNSKKKLLAQENIVKLFRNLEKLKNQGEVRSVLLKAFFDAKSGEIIDNMKDYPDRNSIIPLFKRVDPAHAAKYEESFK